MTPNEIRVLDIDGYVQLWFVSGRVCANECWPTKELAEVAARRQFPNETPGARYSRIFFRSYVNVELT